MLNFLGLWKYAIYAAVILAIVGSLAYAKHSYDAKQQEIGSQPWRDKYNALVADVEKQKKEAAEVLKVETEKVKTEVNERDKRIANIIGAYSDERIKREAAFNLERTTHKLYDSDARCGESSNRAKGIETKATGSTKAGGGGVELSERLNGLLWDLLRDTQTTIEQYRTCQEYARELSD